MKFRAMHSNAEQVFFKCCNPWETSEGFTHTTFHDLRRFNATVIVGAGVDLKTAQVRLGHADPRLTLALYAQATTAGDLTAVGALEKSIQIIEKC